MNNQDKILQDIFEAIKENDLTRHEMAQKGFNSQLCTICWLWDCMGEYTHFTNSIDELWGIYES